MRMWLFVALFAAAGSAADDAPSPTSMTFSAVPNDPSVIGTFAGSSPCDPPIRRLLGIPQIQKSDLIRWQVTLFKPATGPTRYELVYQYGATFAGKAGHSEDIKAIAQEGTWTTRRGIGSNPDAVVYELGDSVALVQVSDDVLHVLNPDGTLMIGDGGWSFTLNRVNHAEPLVSPRLARAQTDMTYPIAPVASGPDTFGVFEGRTPCQGIAHDLRKTVEPSCTKAKWRVTLLRDPATRAPQTYRVEGSLFAGGAREGTWSLTRGIPGNANATVVRLGPTATEPPVLLLKGDDNVLFFLGEDGHPRVGHRDFSYTLNRRGAS